MPSVIRPAKMAIKDKYATKPMSKTERHIGIGADPRELEAALLMGT